MSRVRLGLLSLIAILSLVILSSTASAAIKFEWKVKEKTLAAGESKEFTATADGHVFDLKGSAAGVAVLLLSSEFEVENGAKIIGGKPGTDEETVIFKGVTVDKPEKCSVESEGSATGTVKTKKLKTEIVESDETHEPLILFQPKEGTIFASLLLLNKGTETCLLAGSLANVTGNFLGVPLPALTETLNGHIVFEAPTKKYVLSNATLEEAGLLFAGNAANLSGLALVILKSDEKYGAF